MTRAPMIAATLGALLLAGCSLAPRTVLPAPPVPPTWPAGSVQLAANEAALPVVSYRDIFTDPRLQTLIASALDNNRDIRVAAANLAAARAQVRVTRANQFPEIGVGGNVTRVEQGGGKAGDNTSYSAQGGVSGFELDLFGKLANATQAQRDAALSTEAGARTVRLGVIADLALAWATYAYDRELLDIARSTADNAQRSVTLTTARLKGGVAPRTDVRQAEQILETARGAVAAQQAALAQDINAVRLLVGGGFDETLLPTSLADVTAHLAVLPAGTSSQVLLRRPDVIGAEYDLRAANADIGVARAQLFPSISLTGLLGFASNALSSLFTSGAFAATGAADASWSLFNAGGKTADVDVAKAQRDAALATYEKTIQTAFREVADALADQATLGERLRAAVANTAAAQDTARLTEARYREGVDSYLSSLDAQRSLYTARNTELALRLQVASNRITLYSVLGGDQAAATPQS
ncbi:efflux transporter outer membrane subunit [Novosphingobium colocasiae]|uniref:AdeC/adeK/oprM family multidrug efflux complex outer membrane factor n=1 Tax=Novosphingobium colocasiae TaxID=1256513 RepID=A0A918PB10_9SPHN|nr:efflux transporter outer membrane subunit [Novosphingobium colocasiae]GGY96418.1 adeC/adeK/oprM family multidrug efflux complex outer membrane factor [Novosphingobium colocasiae]